MYNRIISNKYMNDAHNHNPDISTSISVILWLFFRSNDIGIILIAASIITKLIMIYKSKLISSIVDSDVIIK